MNVCYAFVCVGQNIYKKAFSERFGFDLLELRKLELIRQKQSNGNAS